MKSFRFAMVALTVASLFFASCGTTKKASTDSQAAARDTLGQKEFLIREIFKSMALVKDLHEGILNCLLCLPDIRRHFGAERKQT